MSAGATAKKWEDALAAFGAYLLIERLPEHEETRMSFEAFLDDTGEDAMDRPCRIQVIGRENVSGLLLVEIDNCRDEIIREFS